MDGLTITDISLTNDAAKDVLTTALEAGNTFGFGYWGTASAIRRDRQGRVTSMVITEHEAYGHGSKKPRSVRVEFRSVQYAILRILEDGGKATEYGAASKFLRDGIDGPAAEAIIQVMCFGKVIYG